MSGVSVTGSALLESVIRPVPFVPHSAPYGDFAVVIEPSDEVHERLVRLGATIRSIRNVVVYTWGLPVARHVAIGHGVVDGRYVVGPKVLDRSPSSIPLGPCVTLSVDDESVAVITDDFGMQAVFHGMRMVTNRIHLAAIINGDGLDVDALLTTAHSNNMFCQQYNVFDMPVPGVRLAHPGDRFRVGAEVSVERHPLEVDYGSELEPAEYWALIETGASEIVANVEAIIDSGLEVVCDVTGGQDSRVLFAAVVAAGRAQDVRFHTKQPSIHAVNLMRTSSETRAAELARLDVEIATSLVHEYGGRFTIDKREEVAAYRYTDVASNTLRRRSQSFGEYHFVTPNVLRTAWAVAYAPQARMMGGGGELYRNYYQSLLRRLGGAYERERMRQALIASRNGDIDWSSAWPGVEQKLLETFDELPGLTFDHKLDNHYLYFRNRFHFGLTESSVGGGVNLNPILSRSLLSAARMLPQEEKASGRVLFDVTKALVDRIAYHPYDKFDFTGLRSSRFHRPSDLDDDRLEIEPHLEMLPSEGGSVARRRPRPGVQVDLVSLGRAANQMVMHALREAEVNKASVAVPTDLFTPAFFVSAYELPVRSLSWYSRFQSFYDLAFRL